MQTIYWHTDEYGNDIECTADEATMRATISVVDDGVLYAEEKWYGGEWHATNDCEVVDDESVDEIAASVRAYLIRLH